MLTLKTILIDNIFCSVLKLGKNLNFCQQRAEGVFSLKYYNFETLGKRKELYSIQELYSLRNRLSYKCSQEKIKIFYYPKIN